MKKKHEQDHWLLEAAITLPKASPENDSCYGMNPLQKNPTHLM